MEFMDREDMLRYLEELNSRLKDSNRKSDIIIFGGAAMALVHGAREATQDIDAKYRSFVELRRAIKSISEDFNINENWLNNDGEHYITEKMLTNLYLEFSNLKVYTLNADCLLAMKLTSARMDSTDMDDSIFLMDLLNIQSEEQLVDIIEKYIDEDNRATSTKFFTNEAFLQYKIIKSKSAFND
jgi:hypothetical protein